MFPQDARAPHTLAWDQLVVDTSNRAQFARELWSVCVCSCPRPACCKTSRLLCVTDENRQTQPVSLSTAAWLLVRRALPLFCASRLHSLHVADTSLVHAPLKGMTQTQYPGKELILLHVQGMRRQCRWHTGVQRRSACQQRPWTGSPTPARSPRPPQQPRPQARAAHPQRHPRLLAGAWHRRRAGVCSASAEATPALDPCFSCSLGCWCLSAADGARSFPCFNQIRVCSECLGQGYLHFHTPCVLRGADSRKCCRCCFGAALGGWGCISSGTVAPRSLGSVQAHAR